MAGISPIETAARKEKLLELLPEHNWSIIKAGIAAGWSPKYAKTTLQRTIGNDASLCKRINEERQAIEAKTGDRREKRLHDLDKIIDDSKVAYRDRIKAIEVQGKMCGWLSETRVLEVSGRQAELTASQQAEARRLALLRFKSLPDKALPMSDRPVGQIMDAGVVEIGPKQAENQPDQAKNEQAGGDPATPQAEPTQPFTSAPAEFCPKFLGSPVHSGPVLSEISHETGDIAVQTPNLAGGK